MAGLLYFVAMVVASSTTQLVASVGSALSVWIVLGALLLEAAVFGWLDETPRSPQRGGPGGHVLLGVGEEGPQGPEAHR